MVDDLFVTPEARIALNRAIEFFGNKELAREWFFRRIPSLGHNRPYDLLDKPESCQAILDVFAQAEDGAY